MYHYLHIVQHNLLLQEGLLLHKGPSYITSARRWVSEGRKMIFLLIFSTGKSLSEALILASINQKYDDRLFTELRVQYNKTKHSVDGVDIKLF